jgi:hypothetical protein
MLLGVGGRRSPAQRPATEKANPQHSLLLGSGAAATDRNGGREMALRAVGEDDGVVEVSNPTLDQYRLTAFTPAAG